MTISFRCAAVAVLAAAASAQTPVLSVHGATPADRFGSALAALGDLDGDGHEDFLVGASADDAAGVLAGSATVVSGFDGSTLRQHLGIAALDRFGSAVAAAGDVDGDGTTDYVVGAPEGALNGVGSGYAVVFSGATGLLLWQFLGDLPGDRLGGAVAGGVDVDADGRDDVIAGSFGSDAGGAESGLVRVYSGRTGAILHSIPGQAGDRLGIAVDGLSDVNADGRDDVVVGADQDALGAGYAVVLSGLTGGPVHRHDGQNTGDATGFSVRAVGRVDGDATVDFAVGSPGWDGPGSQAGRVALVSGASGAVIHTVDGAPGAQLGRALSPAGDDDGDGRDDVLAGAPFEAPAGAAHLISGFDGSVSRSWSSAGQGDDFGAALAVADVTADQVPDVLIGAPRSDAAGVDSGSVHAYDATVPPPVPPVAYCTAKPSSIGCVAAIGWSGQPSATDAAAFVVGAQAVDSGRPGILMTALGPAGTPFQGGFLCVAAPLVPTAIQISGGAPGVPGCTGAFAFDLNAWMQAGGLGAPGAGTSVYAQYWYRDPASASGPYGLTDAVHFVVAP